MSTDYDAELAAERHARQDKLPRVWTFPSSGEAYDTSQWNDQINDGDVLAVPTEGTVAILYGAWPVVARSTRRPYVTDRSGAFHTWQDGHDWTGHCDYAASFGLALLWWETYCAPGPE